jgi:hypothetical protein
MTNRLEIKQDLHQAHWEVERHYRRQNTMAKSTNLEQKPMIRIVVLDPPTNLIMV